MRGRGYRAALVSLLGALAFTASAVAGNPHGAQTGGHKASTGAGASAKATTHASVKSTVHGKAQAHASAHAQARAHASTRGRGSAHAGARTRVRGTVHTGASTHATTHTGTQTSVTSATQAGVKPSSRTGFNMTASASSNQTKLYGNGTTAGQIALRAGNNGMLFGPGNSQPHKTGCGSKSIDVHALKAHAALCASAIASTIATTATAALRSHGRAHVKIGASTHTQTAAGVQAGLKPSSSTGFDTTASASSNQTKLYGNGTTAGQIALQAGNNGMLFGPGNSQPHKISCGGKSIDVHALKAQAGACAANSQSAVTSTNAAGTGAATQAAQSNTQASTAGAKAAAGKRAGVAAVIKAKAKAKGGVLGAQAAASQKPSSSRGGVLGASAGSGTLPFTGLPLWIALALAGCLLALGSALRVASRNAH